MIEAGRSPEDAILTRALRLNALVTGVVAGLVAGLVIFAATNWLVLKGGEHVGPHLALLGQFFVGYRVTFAGSLVGFAYGFVSGGLVGMFVAFVYNRIVALSDPRARMRA